MVKVYNKNVFRQNFLNKLLSTRQTAITYKGKGLQMTAITVARVCVQCFFTAVRYWDVWSSCTGKGQSFVLCLAVLRFNFKSPMCGQQSNTVATEAGQMSDTDSTLQFFYVNNRKHVSTWWLAKLTILQNRF